MHSSLPFCPHLAFHPARDGHPSPQSLAATGRFTMMGVEVPLRVTAETDPVVANDGTPRLLIAASFELSISEPFNLKGPHGTAPENQMLEFFLRFPMVEKRD